MEVGFLLLSRSLVVSKGVLCREIFFKGRGSMKEGVLFKKWDLCREIFFKGRGSMKGGVL